jgi:hypothetical protein
MATETTPEGSGDRTHFTVDLGEIELSDAEVNSLQSQISRMALERAKDIGARLKFGRVTFVNIVFRNVVIIN